MRVLDAEEERELRRAWQAVLDELPRSPRAADLRFEEERGHAISPLVEQSLSRGLGPTMRWIKNAREIATGPSKLPKLAEQYGIARREDRQRLVRTAVEEMIRLGVAADGTDDGAPQARAILQSLGSAFGTFVFSGTVAQQLSCKLAVYLGLNEPDIMPRSLLNELARPLFDAMITVIQVGAPATRDIAVEGAGALLKLFGADLSMLPAVEPIAGDRDGDHDLNRAYAARLRRRFLMVCAVAGHEQSRDAVLDDIDSELNGQYVVRADLLRTLPALWRQARIADRPAILERGVKALRAAAATIPDERASAQFASAFAHHQESAFRTIELMVERGAEAAAFDDVVAKAVTELPRTLVGPTELCNAQTRATVAIVATAATLVSRLTGSKTEAALEPFFKQLHASPSIWTNPGLIEGCYRSLPVLLWKNEHNKWTRPALEALFRDLGLALDVENLEATHRRTFAHSCLRRLLTALSEQVHTRRTKAPQINGEDDDDRVENAIRTVLAHATPDIVLDVFQPETRMAPPVERHYTPAPLVIGAVAFQTQLLTDTAELFQKWNDVSPAHQLRLIRILAAQLRAQSYDARETARYPLVRRLFDQIPTVTRDDDDRQDVLLRLLSTIPSHAAEAADADLQDFVEHRSGGSDGGSADLNDLPGYVLAMISDSVSYRLAADIAREIHLSLLRARLEDATFDFAIMLYQVTLRGPHRRVFEHLLPRIRDPRDRELVVLYMEHVDVVTGYDLDDPHSVEQIRDHLGRLIPKLAAHESDTLRRLGAALAQYLELVSHRESVWTAIKGGQSARGGFGNLLGHLDDLAAQAHVRHAPERPAKPAREKRDSNPNRRTRLSDLCDDDCRALRDDVKHYLELPVQHFADRERALAHAAAAAARIEGRLKADRGLQPPEQVLLVSLLRGWRALFLDTIEHYVEHPRRCVEARKVIEFWESFVLSDGPTDRAGATLGAHLRAMTELVRGRLHRFFDKLLFAGAGRPKSSDADPNDLPPPCPGQALAFERFFVDWMSRDLDVPHLKWALSTRWPLWFKAGYWCISTLTVVLLLILAPCVVAARLHWAHEYEAAGVLFFAYFGVVFSFVAITLLSAPFGRGRKKANQYRFHSCLPRLMRLIVLALAVLVDFEHSYEFPMVASNAVLVTIMPLAFLTTWLFVSSQVFGNEYEQAPERVRDHKARRRQVRHVVALALAHAFALSLLFGTVFGSNYIEEPHHDADIKMFAGFIPTHARYDLGSILKEYGMPPGWITEHLHFDFHPTLILTWTALGLFFGVFLEGALKGERIGGEGAG